MMLLCLVPFENLNTRNIVKYLLKKSFVWRGILVVEIIGIMSKSPTNKIALRTFIEVTYNDVSQLTPELVMVDFMNWISR